MLNELSEADFLGTVNHGMLTCVPGSAALEAALHYGDNFGRDGGDAVYCTSARSSKYTHMLYECGNDGEYLVLVIENEAEVVTGHYLMKFDARLVNGALPGDEAAAG